MDEDTHRMEFEWDLRRRLESKDVNRAMAMAQPLVDSLSCIGLQPQSSESRAMVMQA